MFANKILTLLNMNVVLEAFLFYKSCGFYKSFSLKQLEISNVWKQPNVFGEVEHGMSVGDRVMII
jgi:hypothetical protein